MRRFLDAPDSERAPTCAPIPSAARPDPARRPLKVLIVDTAVAFGGTLVVARNLLRHLDSNLVDASLVSACADGFVSRGFAGNTEIRLLGPRVSYVTLRNWKQAIRRRFRPAALRRGLALMAMGMEFLGNMAYVMRLAYLCRKMRVDVLHANNFAIEPLWAARLLGIPIVSHLHGFIHTPVERSRRNNFRHIDAFVSISRAVTESAVKAGIDPTRIHEIPNFLERVPGAPPPMPAELAVGIFGRVTDWKGQKEFLRAMMHVLPDFPGLRIYVVGDASDGDPKYFEECVEIARSSPFFDQIEFTGLVTDVATYYRRCTVVVHASIEPEPFGMVLIEAMTEARPVVASVLGAAPEIVHSGVDGFLVDPSDELSLASRISELLSDPPLAAKMGLSGYEKVRKCYDPRVAAKRFEHVYMKVAQSRAASLQ